MDNNIRLMSDMCLGDFPCEGVYLRFYLFLYILGNRSIYYGSSNPVIYDDAARQLLQQSLLL